MKKTKYEKMREKRVERMYRILHDNHLEWKIVGYTYTEIQEQDKEQGKRARLASASSWGGDLAMRTEKKIIAEFRKMFIPKNKTGNISMERYLGICKGIEKFLLQIFVEKKGDE